MSHLENDAQLNKAQDEAKSLVSWALIFLELNWSEALYTCLKVDTIHLEIVLIVAGLYWFLW